MNGKKMEFSLNVSEISNIPYRRKIKLNTYLTATKINSK
jgi:hypothetical protein